MMEDDSVQTIECPVLYALKIIGRKWALKTLCELNKNKVMRYGELKRALNGVTNMALTQLLKDLIEHGIVNRVQYNEIPPKVEYSLTDAGKKILPSLYSIAHWGSQQMKKENIVCSCGNECYSEYFEYVPIEILEDIKTASKTNDVLYQELYEELVEKEISTREKLKHFILGTIEILTQKGGEYARWELTFSFRNDTPNLFREDRVFYQRMCDLIVEAKEKGLLKNTLEIEQIISILSRAITGSIGDWEIASCSYDLIEKNAFFIEWLCEQLIDE